MTVKKKIRGRVAAPNVLAFANLIKLLEQGTMSAQELCDECGLSRLTVYRYCRALHQVKAAHIAMFEKDGRGSDTVKIYKLGAGVDAKRETLPKNFQRDARRKRDSLSSLFKGAIQ